MAADGTDHKSSLQNAPRRGLVGWFHALAPGILIAATGVGAGDMITATLAGSVKGIGLTILWAALAGAMLKWVANEGLARWQMATGTTLLEGWVQCLGRWFSWVFLGYLLVWSFWVAGVLAGACGVAGTGLWQIGDDVQQSKIIWGVLHSLVGVVLVLLGGFALFEKIMSVCIAVMFVTVLATVATMPSLDWSAAARGALVPAIPDHDQGLTRVLSVLGGVGGTLTLLSYGYWIRERRRSGLSGVRACRLDLSVGYAMTALFGLCMIIIGSAVELDGKGAGMALVLADKLGETTGPAGRWVFLIGFWGAVFSSLLGVWQSVPYMFADFLAIRSGVSADERRRIEFSKLPAYRVYLIGMATIPLVTLWYKLNTIQLTYSILGAFFFPFVAVTLLVMNNRTAWVGRQFRSGWIINGVLLATTAFFVYAGARQLLKLSSGISSLAREIVEKFAG